MSWLPAALLRLDELRADVKEAEEETPDDPPLTLAFEQARALLVLLYQHGPTLAVPSLGYEDRVVRLYWDKVRIEVWDVGWALTDYGTPPRWQRWLHSSAANVLPHLWPHVQTYQTGSAPR